MKSRGGKFRVIIIIAGIWGYIMPAFSAAKLTVTEEKARELRGRGYTAQVNGDIDAAMSFYQQALTLDPSCAILYNDLGVICEAKGEIEKAAEYYSRCINTDPVCLGAYSNLALLYEGKGDFPKAVEYWKKRVELGKDDNDPWTIKARQHLQDITAKLEVNNKKEEENQRVVIPGENDGKNDEKKDTIGRILNKLADNVSSKKLTAVPQSAAGAVEENKELKDKLRVYSEALAQEKVKNNKEKAILHERLGSVYVKAKMYNEAIAEYKKSLVFASNNPRIYYYLGLLYQYQRKDSKTAVECFREYLALTPYGEYNEKARDIINILQE